MREDKKILECTGLCKEYHGHKVLKNVSMRIHKGEKIAILGPSGAGKSTLMRCLHLLEPVSDGKIYLEDKLVNCNEKRGKCKQNKIKDTVQARMKMATVFQQFNLFPHMTVLQNIIEGPTRVLKLQRNQAIEIAMSLLRRIGLEEKSDAYPSQLSGGQQQRVAIMRSVAMNPIMMFFDEVTSALDPQLVSGVLDLMRDLAKNGMTMMIVTHEIGFAKEIADQIVLMVDGEIIEIGKPDKMFYDADSEITRDFFKSILKGTSEW